MISMDKQYQTRVGRKVKIYSVNGGGFYPVHGAVLIRSLWVMFSWSSEGYINEPTDPDVNDLIEVPKIIKGYTNIYKPYEGCKHPSADTIWPTKEQALNSGDPEYCVAMGVYVEFKEREGL